MKAVTLPPHGKLIEVDGRNLSLSKAYDKPMCIIIETVEETASRVMVKTMWMWCTEWAKHYGSTKEECYNEFKVRFLGKELQGEAKHGQVFQDIRDLWEKVSPEMKYRVFGSMIRTEWASLEQMYSAMVQFETWAKTVAKIPLTNPDRHHKVRQRAIESGLTQTVEKAA